MPTFLKITHSNGKLNAVDAAESDIPDRDPEIVREASAHLGERQSQIGAVAMSLLGHPACSVAVIRLTDDGEIHGWGR